MYGWWSGYFSGWWQESLSHSYREARDHRSTPALTPTIDCVAATDHAPLAPQPSGIAPAAFEDWPFDQALCLLNEDLCITKVSRNFARVTGLSAPENDFEMPGLLREDARSHFLYCLQEIIFTDSVRMQPMLRARLAQRPEHWVHISGMRQGNGILIALRDITQEMHLERELVRARINADLAQRARSEFLGRMSHELRTPLNAVIGFSQMIEEEVAGPLQHPVYADYLQHIRQSGVQLLDKINNLLAISEAELGSVELQEEPVALAAFAQRFRSPPAFCFQQRCTAFATRTR